MKSLVVGGAGLVGSHLVDLLIARGDDVTVLDNFLTGRPRNLAHLDRSARLDLVNADLLAELPEAIRSGGFERVYHLASPASPVHYRRYPLQTLLVNSVGTQRLLDLSRASGARFLLASTSEVYGDPLVHPQPETYWGHVNPVGERSCYDEGKRFAESLSSTYAREFGVDVRIARIFNTYGPRSDPNDGRVIPNFAVQALRGEPLTIYGDGSQTRSFCYVEDLVRGLHALMEKPGLAGEVVNLGNPVEYSIAEIAEKVIALAGSTSRVVQRPLPSDDPVRRRPDISKARRLLGWSPEVSLADGLQPTLDYFRRELGSMETALAAGPDRARDAVAMNPA